MQIASYSRAAVHSSHRREQPWPWQQSASLSASTPAGCRNKGRPLALSPPPDLRRVQSECRCCQGVPSSVAAVIGFRDPELESSHASQRALIMFSQAARPASTRLAPPALATGHPRLRQRAGTKCIECTSPRVLSDSDSFGKMCLFSEQSVRSCAGLVAEEIVHGDSPQASHTRGRTRGHDTASRAR